MRLATLIAVAICGIQAHASPASASSPFSPAIVDLRIMQPRADGAGLQARFPSVLDRSLIHLAQAAGDADGPGGGQGGGQGGAQGGGPGGAQGAGPGGSPGGGQGVGQSGGPGGGPGGAQGGGPGGAAGEGPGGAQGGAPGGSQSNGGGSNGVGGGGGGSPGGTGGSGGSGNEGGTGGTGNQGGQVGSGGASDPGQTSSPAAERAVEPEIVGSITPRDSGGGAPGLPGALAPADGSGSLVDGRISRSAVLPSLSFTPGTSIDIVSACRQAVIAAARPHGVIRVDASSAGPTVAAANGDLAAPIEVRIVYARQGGNEIRQSRTNCRLDASGRVTSLL